MSRISKKFILFDLDGTIIDPMVGITRAVCYSLESFGIQVKNSDELVTFIGPPLRDSYKTYYGFDSETVEKAVEKYREYFTKQGIYENTLYDGMKQLLEELYENGYILIIATSKPTVYAEEIIRSHNLEKYFTFIAGSELDGRRSIKYEVIRHAFEHVNNITPDNAIMIGDKEHDIIGAKKAGIDSIGVLYGYGDMEELKKAGADYIVEDVKKLHELFL